MAFDPQVNQEIIIDTDTYRFAEHPSAPGIPFGQEGRAAVVYKLDAPQGSRALKVFKTRFRTPELASLASRLAPYASIPGLTVCKRSVLIPQHHAGLLRQYPDLTYAVLMPWIEGPTWLQVLQEKTALSPSQSHSLAQSFAQILSEMEQQGMAHCDLSAANLILPFLSPNEKKSSYAPIELVDVEQACARNLLQPEVVPSGSDGYAHKTVRQEKLWNVKADRFAGAILLAEMLCWSDSCIRENAWGESYFDPQELQRISSRYDLLHHSILEHWGENTAALLERAWQSELLADCPTFGEWMVALPETRTENVTEERTPALITSSEDKDEDQTVTTLLALADRMVSDGNQAGALEFYNQALALVPEDDPVSQVIRALISSVTIEKSVESTQKINTQATEKTKNQGHTPHKRDHQNPSRRSKVWFFLIGLLVMLAGIFIAYQVLPTNGKLSSSQKPFSLAAMVASSVTPTTVPSRTPLPTSTPSPTLTRTPTIVAPEFLDTYLKGVTITRLDTFDRKESDKSFSDQNARVQNGQLYLTGNGYTGGLNKNQSYREGEGVMFDFKLLEDQPTPKFEFETFFENGTWMTDGYKRFGVYITSSPQANLFMGKNGTGNYLVGNLTTIKKNVWYRLFMVIGGGGDFLCVIWDPDNPTQTRYFRQPMGRTWADLQWGFALNGSVGNMEIDNFMDFTFERYSK